MVTRASHDKSKLRIVLVGVFSTCRRSSELLRLPLMLLLGIIIIRSDTRMANVPENVSDNDELKISASRNG